VVIRSLFEKMSRNLVLRRRLPPRLGGDLVYVSPDAALKYWRWDMEKVGKDLFDFAEEFVKPGDVVWDLGANVGMFTFAATFRAKAAGHVVAVECDTFLVDLLRRSSAVQSKDRAKVVVLPVAVSDAIGIVEFHIAKRGRQSNYLASSPGGSQTGGTRETVSVMSVTLDWLLDRLPPPRVLKIDVEGAEASVLRGGQRLLSGHKPIIYCEAHDGYNADALVKILHAHGYSLYNFVNRAKGKLVRAPFHTLAIYEE
jgi:FkbM family methyltransferase